MENDRIQINEKMEILLSGGVIREQIVEEMTYDFEHSSEDNLWSVLYLTGYLTRAALEDTPESAASGKTALRIPNEEVKTIFAETVAKWFTDHVGEKDRTGFFQDWWNGNADRLTKEVSDILFDTISYFDYKEDYYHAFVAGLFSGAGYEVSSNSEQGTGRADVVVKDRRRRRAIIIEIKRCASSSGMEEECGRALRQIRKRQYAQSLAGKGYETVLCYGAVFCAKKCLIRAAG